MKYFYDYNSAQPKGCMYDPETDGKGGYSLGQSIVVVGLLLLLIISAICSSI